MSKHLSNKIHLISGAVIITPHIKTRRSENAKQGEYALDREKISDLSFHNNSRLSVRIVFIFLSGLSAHLFDLFQGNTKENTDW